MLYSWLLNILSIVKHFLTWRNLDNLNNFLEITTDNQCFKLVRNEGANFTPSKVVITALQLKMLNM